MVSRAITKYVRISPYKLRPYADVIRGHSVDKAFAWLKNCAVGRAEPLLKTLYSAYSNACDLHKAQAMDSLVVKEVRIDQGPIVKYFKPGAMGRASMQRKRMCHIQIILDKAPVKKVASKA